MLVNSGVYGVISGLGCWAVVLEFAIVKMVAGLL